MSNTLSTPGATTDFDDGFFKILADSIPRLYWFRDYHTIDGDSVKIRVRIVCCDPDFDVRDLECELADRHVTMIVDNSSGQRQSDSFWFLPSVSRVSALLSLKLTDFIYSESGEDPAQYLPLTLRRKGIPCGELYTFQVAPAYERFQRTPSIDRIERVSGKGATAYNYWNNGRTDFQRFSWIAREHGIDLSSERVNLLDWGCGCGRITRHWLALEGGPARVTGADIDPDNIRWCREVLSPHNFSLVNLLPPSALPREAYDVIVGNSVLTHLKREVMEKWLHEIMSLLKPGGLAILSYHGNFSVAGFCSTNKALCENVWSTGINTSMSAPELNEVIGDQDYYRQTFMTDTYAADFFRHFGHLERVYTGVVSRFQNVAVLRKGIRQA